MAKNELSKYQEISKWIKENIKNGTFTIGSKIPSENEIANQFGFSRQTVRQAIGNLAAEGVLVREQGSGTFVNDPGMKVKTENTMRVGVITTYLNDYIFPNIIHGMENVLTNAGYTLTLGITYNKPANEEQCIQNILQNGVDGFIIEGTKTSLPNANRVLYEKIRELQIPVVFINGYYSDYGASHIVMDDVKAGEILTNLLLEQGHTKIGGIFKSDDIQGVKRYEGVISTIKKNGLSIRDESIIWYTTEDKQYLFGGGMDKILLERLKDVTAIICYNDQVAADLISLLNKNNLTVPRDISIASFDNSFLAEEQVYNLTSIEYPAREVGEKAAEVLLRCINNPKLIEKIKLEPQLITRKSILKLN
ncbi:GntR family transcriptional regulator [Lachnospiraceae bacterium MD1]|uniref:GntR family transcriptional regulator n=1 Tax=Variimorphobacter saccharofermentans TaxID=2755051 RepID=A0A839JW69_9FIRM|nr:GntR family transcriptional regulator [Variimorphobacter saccharofermentans]MBB2181478.1 GntR family transcriptional regulator [Variimorphobacter saccharofermentans]